MNTNTDNTRTTAARAFVRSLNILLKFARMYDFGHPRTKKQYDTAWTELRTALGSDQGAGLLLAVSADQLLLDGTPLESAAAEKAFARMLSSAGIASIHFSPTITQASLAKFARGFPTGTGAKPAQLAEQLKAALEGDPHIHVNEVCFVPADSAVAKSTIARQLATRTLGMNSEQTDEIFNDPEKLLQLIMAAEGTKGGAGDGSGGGYGPGGGFAGPGSGSGDGQGSGDGSGGSGGGYGPGGGPGWLGGGSGYGTGTGLGNGSGDGSGGGRNASVGGPVGAVNGATGTWNIVNGSGSGEGTALDPNAGGFWLKGNDGNGAPATSAGAPGVLVAGMSGSGGNTPGATGSPVAGADGTWNIVNGSGGNGAPVDPNLGGFWLKGNDGAAPSAAGVSGSGQLNAGSSSGGNGSTNGPTSGPAGTWNIVNGSGGSGAPVDPNAGGFWLKEDGATGSSVPSGSGSGISGSGQSNAGSAVGSSGYWQAPNGAPGAGGGTGSGARGGRGSSRAPNTSAPNGPGGPNTPGRWNSASKGIRTSRSAQGNAGSMAVETGLMTMHEDELQGILQVLAQMARTGDAAKIDPSSFQSRLSTLPRRARFTVSQALSALAAQAPAESANKPTLLKLAEHIAVRFALESYERGDVKVNAVRELLGDMNQELDGLRKILGVYEEKLVQAGIPVQSHTEALAQEFWANVSDEKKKSVLQSADAWCVPAPRIREYAEALRSKGETVESEKILRNYASCITNKTPSSRRHVAMGLAELASLYAGCDEQFFIETIRLVGVQLAEENDSELQSLVGAAFVRLSQEASKRRSYSAVQRSVELIDYVETERPGIGKSLRPRIAVEDRLPDFIDEAIRSGEVPSGLSDLLRRMPQPAAEQIAARFTRAGFREDCELLVTMIGGLGPEALDHLRVQLRQGNPTDAVNTIGILARIDLETLMTELPERMKEWRRTIHDRVVRQIASSGSPERGRLLLGLFDSFDPVIRPLALDEIGMSGESSADMRLLRMAEGDLPKGATQYLRLKAIEALGRLRTPGAEGVLRKIAEARKTFRWANPSELRLVAAQAMDKLDPVWVKIFMPNSGLSSADFSLETLDADPNSSAMRQRRYPRLRLEHPVPATTTNLKDNYRLEIPEMALGGGVAMCEQSLHPGSIVELRLNPTQKSVKAQTIVRDANTQARAFEVVDMDLEERFKLRKLLVQLGNAQKQSTPKERSRRGFRTINSNLT